MNENKDKFQGFFGQLAQLNPQLYGQTAEIEYNKDKGFIKPAPMPDIDFREFNRLLEEWLDDAPE